MEKSSPEEPNSIIDDGYARTIGAPPHRPPEKLPEMFFEEEEKQPKKPKQSADRCEKTGKRKLTKDQAQKEASWFRRERQARMWSYRCKSCKQWHIGNNRSRPKQRGR